MKYEQTRSYYVDVDVQLMIDRRGRVILSTRMTHACFSIWMTFPEREM